MVRNQSNRAASNECECYSRLLWFCFSTFCDWLAKFAPLSPPMRKKIKTNRALPARVFPRLAPVTCICFGSDWFIALFTSVVIGQNNYFCFGCTALN